MDRKTWEGRLTEEKRKLFSSRDVVLLSAESCSVLTADKASEGPRRFEMLAYSGAKVQRWWGDLIIDLKGIEREDRTAILYEHVDHWPVGIADEHALSAKGYALRGEMLDNEQAQEICRMSDRKFPWKCSVGVRPMLREEVAEGIEVEVNGQTLKGPLEVWRKTRLFETSFITCSPADANTAAEVMHAQEAAMDPKNAPSTPAATLAVVSTPATPALDFDALLAGRKKELLAAFPKAPEFCARMLMDGKSVSDAWPIYAAELEGQVAKSKEAATLAAVKTEAGDRGIGFSANRSEQGTVSLKHLPVEERARIEVGADPVLQALFRDAPNGRSGQAIYAAALKYENARRVDGSRLMSPQVLRLAAEAFEPECSAALRSMQVMEGEGARLSSWGKTGPDYSTITVKGFLGQFYASFESELSGIWAPKIGLRVESNQETETHKWLGMFPMLSEWLGGVREDGMPIYSFAITNKLYRASIGLDKNDFKFQKYGLINMRIGEAGAVSAEHWNLLVSTLIEANGTCYDGGAFFATTHALGGSAPATQSNLLTSATAGMAALAVSDVNNVTDEEMAKAIQVTVPHLQTLKWANGQPANGGLKNVVVMVPTQLAGQARAALRKQMMAGNGSNPTQVQDINYDLVVNARLTNAAVFYIFRTDCNNKPFILQEPGAPETLWQGPGSYLEWIQHKFGFGIETTRAAGYGAWESSLKCTFN